MKIEHISGSTVQNFTQFVFVVWQVEGYRNILKRSFRSSNVYEAIRGISKNFFYEEIYTQEKKKHEKQISE